ncbi:MAG: hypothetical protein KDK08_17820 [Rhizobiaceae bacterium]|nr:hypothetical protein [Rhizobiaceae bacterium]
MRQRHLGLIEAIMLALMLVLQTLGSAHAVGAGSGPYLLDAFGNPLCITSGAHGDDGQPVHHGALKDCCALGCLNVATSMGMPLGDIEAVRPEARLLLVLDRRFFQPSPPSAPRSNANPRAPPFAM